MAIAIVNDDGQLPAAKATLYTCPASTKGYVKGIMLFNSSGGTETVQLYVKPSGSSSRPIGTIELLTGEYATVGSFGLAAADEIEGSSTNAGAIDYVIDVIEES